MKKHDLFRQLCIAHNLPEPVSEYKFHPRRKFRFDFFFVDSGVAVEIEGGIWTGGRHTRGSGYQKDMEKYNLALLQGYVVYRITPSQIKKTRTYNELKQLITNRGGL